MRRGLFPTLGGHRPPCGGVRRRFTAGWRQPRRADAAARRRAAPRAGRGDDDQRPNASRTSAARRWPRSRRRSRRRRCRSRRRSRSGSACRTSRSSRPPRDAQASLIVLGTQGQTGAARLFFGSTAQRVLRETVTPTLVVPPAASTDRPRRRRPARRSRSRTSSPRSTSATPRRRPCRRRLAWRRAAGARLTLAHVVPEARGLDWWAALVDDPPGAADGARRRGAGAARARDAGAGAGRPHGCRCRASRSACSPRWPASEPHTPARDGRPPRRRPALAATGIDRLQACLCLARTPVLVVPTRLR